MKSNRPSYLLSTLLKPSNTRTPFLKNSPLLSLNPSPYLLANLPEKILSFSEYSQLDLNTLKREVNEIVFKGKTQLDPIVRLNNIEITLQTFTNFEVKDIVTEEIMHFFMNYLLKLQVKENKAVFFMTIINEKSAELESYRQLPKKSLYKYFCFLLLINGKWILILYDTFQENCDILYHPETEITKLELISSVKKILIRYHLFCKTMLIDNQYKPEIYKDSGLLILNFLLELYRNETFQNIKEGISNKNELLWVIYHMIHNQNNLKKIQTKARLSHFNHSPPQSPMKGSYKLKKKPDLKVIITNNLKEKKLKEKSQDKNTSYYLKSAFLKQNIPNTSKSRFSIKSSQKTLNSGLKLPNLSIKTPVEIQHHKTEEAPKSEKIHISKGELKEMLHEMKNEIFKELKQRDYVQTFLSKEIKGDQSQLKLSKEELKKMLRNFKEKINGKMEDENFRKQQEFFQNQVNLSRFQNLLHYYYYYNPEMYEYLSKEFSKRVGEYYMGSLFEKEPKKN